MHIAFKLPSIEAAELGRDCTRGIRKSTKLGLRGKNSLSTGHFSWRFFMMGWTCRASFFSSSTAFKDGLCLPGPSGFCREEIRIPQKLFKLSRLKHYFATRRLPTQNPVLEWQVAFVSGER